MVVADFSPIARQPNVASKHGVDDSDRCHLKISMVEHPREADTRSTGKDETGGGKFGSGIELNRKSRLFPTVEFLSTTNQE